MFTCCCTDGQVVSQPPHTLPQNAVLPLPKLLVALGLNLFANSQGQHHLLADECRTEPCQLSAQPCMTQ